MLSGAPLGRAFPAASASRSAPPSRAALRILDKIEAAGYDVFRRRPVLSALDWLVRALVDARSTKCGTRTGVRMTPDEYCQQKAAASGSSFYYASCSCRAERRRAITALYAFCREVDDVVDEAPTIAGRARPSSPGGARRSRTCIAGNPQHPVTRALLPFIGEYSARRRSA